VCVSGAVWGVRRCLGFTSRKGFNLRGLHVKGFSLCVLVLAFLECFYFASKSAATLLLSEPVHKLRQMDLEKILHTF